MIMTVVSIAVRRLLKNRLEIALTFAVPIAFFSIFALIFGRGIGRGGTPEIKAVVIDQVGSRASAMAMQQITELDGLRLMRRPTSPLSLSQARDLVKRGQVTVAVILQEMASNADPSQETSTLPTALPKPPPFKPLSADLLVDTSDQVAGKVTTALVGQVLATINAAELERTQLAVRGQNAKLPPPPGAEPDDRTSLSNALPVKLVDVLSQDKSNPVVSMYAAGIAVMFLLFGASGGGAALLEERENTTLERLLTTRLTLDQLLLGKWLHQTFLGVVQVSVMFVWGWLVFQIDLWKHLDGFFLMTVVTAGAASSFGLLLATACRSRGQLNGVSVILILTMSALGGSMVPRYLMSDTLREAGLFTFNAWALDGFDKVFWREMPVSELWPQICVLMLASAAMLIVARLLAVRWETN